MRISPGLILAPIRTIPFSSRSLVASSDTLGISLVSSSTPSLVSRTSRVYSSIWIEVKISSRITRSEITIASSKLYPFHGMKATFILRPKANSPFWVAYPSQSTCPFFTLSPLRTIGFRLIQVPWFVRRNLIRSYVVSSLSKDTRISSSVLS